MKGTAANPMTRAEVDEKCADLLAPVLGRRKSRELIDTIWGLEQLKGRERVAAAAAGLKGERA